MKRLSHFIPVIAAFFLCATYGRTLAANKPVFQIVVNAQNSTTSLERDILADIFLKRISRWPKDGHVILPVDLDQDSPVRREFTEFVFRRSISGIKHTWQQAIFSGQNVPPPELKSNEEVIQYVLRNPGAIGYVSEAGVPSGVKTIELK